MTVSTEIRDGIGAANADFMNSFNRGDGAGIGVLHGKRATFAAQQRYCHRALSDFGLLAGRYGHGD